MHAVECHTNDVSGITASRQGSPDQIQLESSVVNAVSLQIYQLIYVYSIAAIHYEYEGSKHGLWFMFVVFLKMAFGELCQSMRTLFIFDLLARGFTCKY